MPTNNDSSLYIRRDEETKDELRGKVVHPRLGTGLTEATVRKENLVGWQEAVVVPRDNMSLWEVFKQKMPYVFQEMNPRVRHNRRLNG